MKNTPLRKVSKRLSSGLAKYEKAKKEYLEEHPACEVCCRYRITMLHHKLGRIGSLLYNKDYFLAVCNECHTMVHNNPKWAYEKGYSLDRLLHRSYE